jgi:hypothetical protein
MTRIKTLIAFLYCLLSFTLHGQDYFGYGGSNYGGVLQLIANPAAGAGSRLKVDVVPLGMSLGFDNSWVAIKKEALAFPKLPPSWKNYTPNFEGNVYKNFEWQPGDNNKEAILEQRLMLPSALVRIDSRSTVGFICSMRQIGNLSGISAPMAQLFEREFDLSVLQNNPVQNKNLVAIKASWIEYGFNYSREILHKGHHKLKAGVTPKLLQGLESSYFILKDLDFLFTNKDTNSFLKADFLAGHSARSGSLLDFTSNISQKLHQSGPLRPGLDLGLIYEWLPAVENEPGKVRIPYKLKAGVSLVDLGQLSYKKELNYYDMQLYIRQNDIVKLVTAENLHKIDSILHAQFPANTGSDKFSVLLPTALNTQLDYAVNRFFFVNLSTHFTGFYSSQFFKVQNYSAICLAPRYESYWVDASLLLTWNALSAKRSQPITPGLNLRFGPLSIGSSDLSFLLRKNSLYAVNLYAMLHVSIPHKPKTKK